ncbi:MAG TPA: hypothetical protein VG370_21520 [Chloroflexota bacterium]|jgi:hypothetical protein|nr:hypothetical protein [Chloroflexota bacterium]
MNLSPLNAFLTRWAFRLMLCKRAYPREELERLAAESRLGGGQIVPDGIGFDLRLVKPA